MTDVLTIKDPHNSATSLVLTFSQIDLCSSSESLNLKSVIEELKSDLYLPETQAHECFHFGTPTLKSVIEVKNRIFRFITPCADQNN